VKYIDKVASYSEGVKVPAFEFNVFSQLVAFLKEKDPVIAVSFQKATTGFGSRVTNEAEPDMPNEALAVSFDHEQVLGHVIGNTYEIKRFLDEYQKCQELTAVELGSKVLYKNEIVIVEWVSTDHLCGAGNTKEGKGFAFNIGDPDLKAFP
jgi:hypothetical protein